METYGIPVEAWMKMSHSAMREIKNRNWDLVLKDREKYLARFPESHQIIRQIFQEIKKSNYTPWVIHGKKNWDPVCGSLVDIVASPDEPLFSPFEGVRIENLTIGPGEHNPEPELSPVNYAVSENEIFITLNDMAVVGRSGTLQTYKFIKQEDKLKLIETYFHEMC